jgi:hypothetical protein
VIKRRKKRRRAKAPALGDLLQHLLQEANAGEHADLARRNNSLREIERHRAVFGQDNASGPPELA